MLFSVVLVGLLVSQTTPAPTANLLESAKLGDLTAVRDLLSRRAPIDGADRRGLTPLMWAAASGNVEVVRHLLDGGAAVDRRANDGSTALMFASANGFLEIVRALVLKGADVTAARGGVTARELALERGHADVAMLLDQAEGLGRRLLQAANEGHDMVVRQVLTLGAPVNIADERGATALMIAARNGDLGILQALLARGADASIRDSQGRTVFDWAEPSSNTAKFVAPSPQVRASLTTLASVMGRVPPASAQVQTAQRRANAALSRLQALSVKWPAESPHDYRDNLSGYIAALEAALKGGNAETLAATVDAVAEDLEVKLEHCTLSGGRLGGSVLVRVRTLQDGAESRSWQVFYMPRVFEAASNATPDLFPQLSSPTEETLVPGRYVMWARDPATARLGERTVVKVGEGKNELLVDLPVPAAAPQ
jgi:hypothetical protein